MYNDNKIKFYTYILLVNLNNAIVQKDINIIKQYEELGAMKGKNLSLLILLHSDQYILLTLQSS